MPRIRSIKHDLYLDEELAQLPVLCRYAFPGLWTLADREGRLEDRPARIKAQLFPYEPVDMDAVLAQLAAGGFVVRYEVGGVQYLQIRSFGKHQQVNARESQSRIPAPPGSTAAPVPPPTTAPPVEEDTCAQCGARACTCVHVGKGTVCVEGNGIQGTVCGDGARTDTRAEVVPFDRDFGAMPTQRRQRHCAWEGQRKGLSVPQFLHEELLSKMATPDEAALLRWYADTERAYQGRDIGEEALAFWRARFREWRGTTSAPTAGAPPVLSREELLAEQRRFDEELAASRARAAAEAAERGGPVRMRDLMGATSGARH